MKRTYWYVAMIHPVESALLSRAARIQQGGDEVQHSRMTFYEAVNDYGLTRRPRIVTVFITPSLSYCNFIGSSPKELVIQLGEEPYF
ncbi:MAG: hypothetical protein KKF00_00945 [Proteobacteria bacterium]|nr:hypothetical protein [Pseudomonadota bacterium]